MIEKLEKQANEAAAEKAFCDEEMAKTNAKKEELEAAVAKATSKIDQATARSTELKDEVKEAQQELATMASEQGRMDEIRREENAAYKKASSELSLGLSGVRKALEVLRDYYGSAALLQQPQHPRGVRIRLRKQFGQGGDPRVGCCSSLRE